MDFEYDELLLLCLGPTHIQDGSNMLLAIFIYVPYHLNRERSSPRSIDRCVCVNKQDLLSLLLLNYNLMEKMRARSDERNFHAQKKVTRKKNTEDQKSDF